jgi:hypothetical protein
VPVPPLADVVIRELTRYLGPHTAKNALRLFAQKAVHKSPDELGYADLEPLLAALRPMLRTLIGSRETDAVLADLRRELG